MLITVLTDKLDINIKFNQSLRGVTGIQLVDYNFPRRLIVFKTAQRVDRNGTNLVTFPPGSYSFAEIVSSINHGVSGISLHGLLNQVHVQNSSGDRLTFTDEIKKVLNVLVYRPTGTSYSLTWEPSSYYLFSNCGENNSAFGYVVRDGRPESTNLLAAIPSMSNTWPVASINDSYPIDSIHLSLRMGNGEIPSFGGKQISISLRILFND